MLSIVSIRTRIMSLTDLGETIKRGRRERHLSQIELAQYANVARSAVQKVEEGRGTVNLGTALKLLHTLSLDLAVVSRTQQHHVFDDEVDRGG
jgi:transcriptional regulator with XRE-family HTH domain